LPFILYSCFGVFWSNLVLLPAASIIPVFILFVLWCTVVYFFSVFYLLVLMILHMK
jgi:hypothetical protein